MSGVRGAWVGLLSSFAVLAAALSALIPLGEAADELSHYSYVRYVAEHGALPPVVPGTTVLGESFQPPLYYALAAPLTAWLPRGGAANLGFSPPVENNPDWELGNPARARVLLQPAAARWPWRGEALGWHLTRLLSVALGVATVWATGRLAALVFPGERWTALLAAALVAFLPSFLGLSAAVTNDALATTLGALLLWHLARLVTGRAGGWRGWALAGLLGALGVWTKASGWVFVGTTVLAAWRTAGIRRRMADGRRQTAEGAGQGVGGSEGTGFTHARSTHARTHALRTHARTLLPAGLAWLLVALPLLALNVARGGDPLGRAIQAQVTEARVALGWGEWGVLLRGLYRTTWAGFGGAVHLHFPEWLNALLLVPLLAGLVGVARRWRTLPPPRRALVALLGAHGALSFAAWLLWSSLVLGTGQGRLLFPALPAAATLLAGGLVALVPRRPHVAALVGGAGAFGLALAAVGTILLPAFRAPPSAPPVPAGATLERWQVGELPLALTAFYLPWTIDDRPPPGSESAFWVAWEASGPLPDLRLRLRWVDREGEAVGAAKEGSPIASHPLTDEWQPGRYAASHRLRLPTEAEPGWHRLMLAVIDPATGEPLPLRGPDGSSGPEIMVGQTTVAAR